MSMVLAVMNMLVVNAVRLALALGQIGAQFAQALVQLMFDLLSYVPRKLTGVPDPPPRKAT